MKELRDNIRKLELEIELLNSSKPALLRKRRVKEISKEDYNFHKKLKTDDDSRKEHYRNINNRLRDYKDELSDRREQQRFKEQNLAGLSFAGIIVVLLGLLFVTNFEGLTGLVPFSPEDTFTSAINQTFTESATYDLDFTNATSLRISGSLIGEGTVRVLLDINGTLFTVFDKAEALPTEGFNLITGRVIQEQNIVEINETIIENISDENVTTEIVVEDQIVIENVTEEIIENITVEEVTENATIAENITIEENTTINVTPELNISEENISVNITPELNTSINISENTTIEIIENETMNVTPEINISENTTTNITEPVLNISENITIEENISINITESEILNISTNISANITENISINVTPIVNVSENLTTNITTNISINITPEINVTENMTINITENVSVNTTENITINVTPEVYTFSEACVETCLLKIANGKLIIEVTNAKLHIDELIYTKERENKPPIQTKEISDITFYDEYVLDASEYFSDPEGDFVIYDTKGIAAIDVDVTGSTITFTSNNTGIYEMFLYATDGSSLVKSNVFRLGVGTEFVENITSTETVDEEITQYTAEIGKPVKWRKVIRTENVTDNLTIKLPDQARNINILNPSTLETVSNNKISIVQDKVRKTLPQYEKEKAIKEIKDKIDKATTKKQNEEVKDLEKQLKDLETEVQNLITGQVIIDIGKEGIITKFFKALANLAGDSGITGRVIQEPIDAILENATIIVEENTTTEEIIIEEVVENITVEEIVENITIEDNLTEPIINISEENLTIETISEEVLENITINVTEENTTLIENITIEENISINITENTTINVTPEINITENITINVTESEILNISTNISTNVTENTTVEDITEPIIKTPIVEANSSEATVAPEAELLSEPIIEENITVDEPIVEPVINVTEPTQEIIDQVIADVGAENLIDVIVDQVGDEYLVEYETDAPEMIEEEVNEYKKIVTISSALHYEKILTYTNITESPRETIGVYWIQNGTRTLFTNITYIDSDENGLIDKLQWVTPHLSNQSFEIIITVLNVQSYPMVGGFWTVRLNTSGEADLEITPYDLTTFLPEPTDENRNLRGDDLEFNNFMCGNESLISDVWITTPFTCTDNTLDEDGITYCYVENNKTFVNYTELMQTELSINMTSVYIYNYSCNETSYLKDIVRTPGAHHIWFDFGPSNASAHNWAVKNASSLTINATISIRTPSASGGAEFITGAYMYLDSVQENTTAGSNTTWKYNYTKNCSFEGDYELYAELLSVGNAGTEPDVGSKTEAIKYWVEGCTIAGTGETNCTVHIKSISSNATTKLFGGRLELSSNCAITSVTGTGEGTDGYWNGANYIEFYHNISIADSTDETTFDITCDDGGGNDNMLLYINETCGPSTCGNAILAEGGYSDCSNPTCSDNYTYIGDDPVESLGGFDLMTYDIGILDTQGWETVSTYNIEWDTDQTDCDCYLEATTCNTTSCYNNATNVIAFPDGGAGYGGNCCGDDENETFNITGYNAATIDAVPTLSQACCNATDSCVFGSACYANGTSLTDIDSDSDDDYCLNSIWNDCLTDGQCGGGLTCNATYDCEDSGGPAINFVSPTPTDEVRQINNWMYINVTAVDPANDISVCLLEWDDGTTITNNSMTKVGSGTSVSCYLNMSTTDGKTYTYRVFANDSLNNMENSTNQSNVENTKPPAPTHFKPENESIVIGNSQFINWTAGGADAEGDTITYAWRIDTTDPVAPTYTCNGTTTDLNSSACSTTDGVTYYWNIVANDGYENQTTTGTWQFTENTKPVNSSMSLLPVTPTTDDDLNCSFNITDAENTSLLVYYKWYNESALHLSSSIAVTNATINSIVLNSSNTSKYQNWTCEITPYDGFENGSTQTITRTISDGSPTINLTLPLNNTAIPQLANRTPTFTWESNDPDGDTLTHIIFISTESDMTPIINWSTEGTALTYTILSDLELDTPYWWLVQVDDGTNYVNSTVFNFTIDSYEAITLVVNSTDFGAKDLGDENDTTNNNPAPLIVRNIGNTYVDLNISAQSALWVDPVGGLDTAYFRFKADNVTGEESSFNSSTIVTWTNMPSLTTTFMYYLNYSDSADEAEIDLYIKVPLDESAGTKESIIELKTT